MTLLHQAAQKAVEALTDAKHRIAPLVSLSAVKSSAASDSAAAGLKGIEVAMNALESALQQQPEPVADGTFWLIERGANQWQSPTMWWSSRPDKVSSYSWVESVHEATHFDSEEAAEAVAQERYVTQYAVTSHSFLAAAPPALQQPRTADLRGMARFAAVQTAIDSPAGVPALQHQEVPREPVNINNDFCPVYAVFGIGSAVRKPDVLLANVENAMRRTRCLDAIEREFFTVPTPPDPDEGDDEPGEECLLNWGSDPEEYVEQFRAALATLAASPSTTRQQEVGSDALDARRYRWLRKNREVTMIVSCFGNGCVNKTIEDAEAKLDAAMAAAPSTPEKAGGVPESIAQCDKCPDPARCAGDACARGFVAHAPGVGGTDDR
jgi:hypothetical protein